MSILVSIFKDFFRHAGNMPPAMMCERIRNGAYALAINPLPEWDGVTEGPKANMLRETGRYINVLATNINKMFYFGKNLWQ
jgi:hypothetical protein